MCLSAWVYWVISIRSPSEYDLVYPWKMQGGNQCFLNSTGSTSVNTFTLTVHFSTNNLWMAFGDLYDKHIWISVKLSSYISVIIRILNYTLIYNIMCYILWMFIIFAPRYKKNNNNLSRTSQVFIQMFHVVIKLSYVIISYIICLF